MTNGYEPYFEKYGPALRDAFGVGPTLISTGGNCMALEMVLETVTVWITEDSEPLSPWVWRAEASARIAGGASPTEEENYFGWCVTVHRNNDTHGESLGGAITSILDGIAPEPEPAPLVALVKAALDDARNGGFNMYGPAGLAGDRIARGLDPKTGE